jgi:hypothetical protein
MTYPAESQRRPELQSDNRPDHPGSAHVPDVGEGLSAEQKRVLDCLQSAESSLTLQELQAAVSCPPEQLRSAIDDLVARDLVCELNTIIPSYLCRYPGISLYAE